MAYQPEYAKFDVGDTTYAVIGTTTIPKAVSYTDEVTVLAVQGALRAKNYSVKLDGLFGTETSKAIKKMQRDIGVGETGVIDYGVLNALGLPAPAYAPTVTTAGRSASAAAKDADAMASYATTPAEVVHASEQVAAASAVALPPPPPEVQIKVAAASAAAKIAASPTATPVQVADAKKQVKEAAEAVKSATSFWGQALWAEAPVKRWQGAVAGAGLLAIVGGFLMARRGRR